MLAVYFFYGLSFFTMGLAVSLESRRTSQLTLRRHLPWLGAFGLLHGCSEWVEMFRQLDPESAFAGPFDLLHAVLLPVSALVLIRFGIGIAGEAGPMPRWMQIVPAILFVPSALLIAYAIVVALTTPQVERATDVWSRYLLYLPGNLLAAYGFLRHRRRLRGERMARAGGLLLCAALAFIVNAFAAGLIVPEAPFGFAPWLNYENVLALTGVPVQVWRMLSAIAITFAVVGMLGIFETERRQEMNRLDTERRQAQQAALRAQAEARRHAEAWVAGLVDVSRSIANLEKVDDVLLKIVTMARSLLNSDMASLALLDESTRRLSLRCYASAEGAYIVPSRPIESQIILRAVQSCCSARYPEDMDGTPWICPMFQRQIGAAAVVPLHLNHQPVGGLWVARFEYQAFSCADLVALERLADQCVIALEHASMTARLQSLAVTEERSRIAREMHDSLAQILGYLSLEMQTLEALVRQGDCPAALAELRQARESIRAAQADVRESILCLRTTLAGDIGLIAALRQYVDEFSMQTGIEAQLISDVPELLSLPPTAEIQLVRIVQEALTNVRKHAQADSAEVRLFLADGELHVLVTDDGIGIQDSAIKRSHFGLQTMRERAESIDGQLAIISSPHEGTQVALCLPLCSG